MPWIKLDDDFFAHRKIIDLSKDAKLLYLAGLTHSSSQLTDGVLTPGAVRAISALVNIRRQNVSKTCSELVQNRLWIVSKDGYEIYHFLDRNPTAAEVREKREATAQRVQSYRTRNAECNAVTSSVCNAVSNAAIDADVDVDTHSREGSLSKGISEDVDYPTPKKTRASASARDGGGGGGQGSQGELAELAMRVSRAAKGSVGAGDDLIGVLSPYVADLGAERIVAETITARDWYAGKKRKLDLRLLGNWLKREQQKKDEANAAATAAAVAHAQAEKVNGHEGQHATDANRILTLDEARAAREREDAEIMADAAERARLVREFFGTQVQQRVPGEVS